MEFVPFLIYLAGMFGAVHVGRARAGVSQRGRLDLGMVARSPVWSGLQMAAIILWPIFLIVWLVQGRPGPKWLAAEDRGGLRVRRRTPQEMQ